MVVRMKSTHSHTRMRRSHHAYKGVQLVKCKKCGTEIPPHTVCFNCGIYNGREVIDMLKKLTKKERKNKEKELKQKEEEKENKEENG